MPYLRLLPILAVHLLLSCRKETGAATEASGSIGSLPHLQCEGNKAYGYPRPQKSKADVLVLDFSPFPEASCDQFVGTLNKQIFTLKNDYDKIAISSMSADGIDPDSRFYLLADPSSKGGFKPALSFYTRPLAFPSSRNAFNANYESEVKKFHSAFIKIPFDLKMTNTGGNVWRYAEFGKALLQALDKPKTSTLTSPSTVERAFGPTQRLLYQSQKPDRLKSCNNSSRTRAE